MCLKMTRIVLFASVFLLAISSIVLAAYDVDKVFKVNVPFPWSMANAKILFKLDSQTGNGALGFESFGEKVKDQPFIMQNGPTKVNFNFKTKRGSTVKGAATINPKARTLFVDAKIVSSFLPDKDFKDTFHY